MDNNIMILIQNIPVILLYFVPGFLCLLIYTYLCSKKIESAFFLILSCVLSYVLVVLTTAICSFNSLAWVLNNVFYTAAFAIVIGVILSAIISTIFLRKGFNTYMLNHFHKTTHTDIWRDILDFENGSNLIIAVKNQDYAILGHYRFHEEKGKDSWVAVSGYIFLDKRTKEPINQKLDYRDDDSKIITISLQDAEYIEVL